MAYFDSPPYTGTSNSDVFSGGSQTGDQTFNGLGGNDLFIGDQNVYNFGLIAPFSNPTDLDLIPFEIAPHPLVDRNDGPSLSFYMAASQNAQHYFSVTVGANETLTVDTDFSTFDTYIQFLDSQGGLLAENDDSPNNWIDPVTGRVYGDPGSDGTQFGIRDSYVSFTPLVETVVYIRVAAFVPGVGIGDVSQGNSTVVNISHNGASINPAIPNSGKDIIGGGDGDDVIFGTDGDDILFGEANNDTIDGGLGTNTMDGGTGTQDFASYATFVPTSGTTGVNVTLASQGAQQTGAGLDTLTNFEGLIGSNFNDILSGNSGDNTLVGGKGGDILQGGGGLDRLFGGDDNDLLNTGTMVGDLVAGEIYDGGAGNDGLSPRGGSGLFDFRSSTLTNLEVLIFTSFGGLAGFTGSKTVVFGANQLANSGIHTFQIGTTLQSEIFTVTINMESAGVVNFSNISTLGFSQDDGDVVNIFGTSGDDVITGTSYGDTLVGNGGTDVFAGHSGNDTYIIDSADDQVFEAGLAFGDDAIFSSVDFDIPDFVERLTMLGPGDHRTNGNDLANFITGNSDNNYINGAGGTDVMEGGDGNDTYTVDDLNDVIVEQAGGGDDAVYSENDVQLSGNIETAILSSTFSTAISAFGDASNNQLFGNEFNNVLYGRGGLDRMGGGAGDDIFVIAMGDQAANVQEQITDFEGAGIAGGDRMGFGGFGAGATVVQVGASSYEVRDAGNVTQASFILEGVTTALTADDYYFT